jgi:hypothetical protein
MLGCLLSFGIRLELGLNVPLQGLMTCEQNDTKFLSERCLKLLRNATKIWKGVIAGELAFPSSTARHFADLELAWVCGVRSWQRHQVPVH